MVFLVLALLARLKRNILFLGQCVWAPITRAEPGYLMELHPEVAAPLRVKGQGNTLLSVHPVSLFCSNEAGFPEPLRFVARGSVQVCKSLERNKVIWESQILWGNRCLRSPLLSRFG